MHFLLKEGNPRPTPLATGKLNPHSRNYLWKAHGEGQKTKITT